MGKQEFKNFVAKKPELADYVHTKEMTWQEFYELYDLYGEDESVWNKYQKKEVRKVSDFMQNLDTDSLQKHIESAQKALNFISELSTKGAEEVSNVVKPAVERPIKKFFGD